MFPAGRGTEIFDFDGEENTIEQDFRKLSICFILGIKEILNLRTRINRAFTSLRTLLVLFRMTIWWSYQVVRA